MTRMTKAIVASLSLLSTPCWSIGEFYIGAGGGLDAPIFHQRAKIRTTTQPLYSAFDATNKVSLAGQGGIASVFGGYEWANCAGFYLAGELNASFSSSEHRQSNAEFIRHSYSRSTFSVDNSYGIGILPGYMLRNQTAVLYARLGYESGAFRIHTSDSSLANADKRLGGFRFGVGLKKWVSKNLSVRLDYSHINYKGYSQFTLDTNSFVSKETQYSPRTNQVLLGLAYNFC